MDITFDAHHSIETNPDVLSNLIYQMISNSVWFKKPDGDLTIVI